MKKENIQKYIPRNITEAIKMRWVSWGDWLGTGNIKSGLVKYLSYNKARDYVHNLNKKYRRMDIICW